MAHQMDAVLSEALLHDGHMSLSPMFVVAKRALQGETSFVHLGTSLRFTVVRSHEQRSLANNLSHILLNVCKYAAR